MQTQNMASDKPLQRAPLMSLDEALSQVLEQVRVLTGTEQIAILDADGRFLAEDLISALQVPPQDNWEFQASSWRSLKEFLLGNTVMRSCQERLPVFSLVLPFHLVLTRL